MARLAMNEMTTLRWSFEEDLQRYAAAGYQAVGVWRQKLSDCGEERGAELLAEKGLTASSLLWAGGFTGSEGRTHKESIEDARDALRSAAAINAPCVVVYTGARAGHTHNHARRLLRSALGELLPLADDLGVTMAIEPMHGGCAADWTFLTDLDETLELLTAVDHPRLRMTYDTYHLAQDGAALERIAEIVPYIAHVQLGDAKHPPDGEQNRCRLGDGSVPLREIVQKLLAAGYSGYFEVELMGEELEASDYEQLLTHSKQKYCEFVNG